MSTSQDAEQSFDSATSDPVDLTSSPHSLAHAVHARRSEYVRPHRIRVKIGSWNVAACPGTDKDLASWFVEGKGVDKNLATLDVSRNAAVEESHGANKAISTEDDGEVRLVGGDKVGLYVLGLQEIVDLNLARDAVNRMAYTDTGPLNKWKDALEAAMPEGYELVATEQLSGLLLLVYASPDVAPTVSNVSTAQVGTGLFGYLGNKGAVAMRILLGETTRLVFVNCHLASGAEQTHLDRRLWDYAQILAKARFDPVQVPGCVSDEHEKIGDEDFAFWLGDLNFRLEGLPGNDIRRLLMLHSRGEYDLSKKNNLLDSDDVLVVKNVDDSSDSSSDEDDGGDDLTKPATASPAVSYDESTNSLPDPDEFLPDPHDDPASLQATLDSLLPHDQLGQAMKSQKAFHEGWREGPIMFLPSYKYDVGTVGLFDSSEKQRAPSWCDRILYRTRRDKDEYDRKVREAEEAKRKDAEMKAQGIEAAAEDDDVLFSYDPDVDAEPEEQGNKGSSGSSGLEYDEYDDQDDGEAGQEDVVTKEGFTDRINLDIYTSHQRITSSDHKPIISVFTLDYDAAVPSLKAKIHSEVARELDRAENEGRPIITIVVDTQESPTKEGSGRPADQGEPVDFGSIGFMAEESLYLTIANNGGVPAEFAFVEKPSAGDNDDASNPPHWLKTSFQRQDVDDGGPDEIGKLGSKVTLEPGETISAVLTVLIDDVSYARSLNAGRAKLEDVLVLRVQDGRDHFIPVCGTWLPTCFGRSIEELIRIPEGGIRAFAQSRPSKGGSIPYDLTVHTAAPRELFKLTEIIEALTTRVLADESMLEQQVIPADSPGWPFDSDTWVFNDKPARRDLVHRLVEALDTDKSLTEALPLDVPAPHRLEVASEMLLLFLEGLTDSIIPAPLWAKTEVALPHLLGSSSLPSSSSRTNEEIEDDKAAVLDILAATPNHNIAFVFLTATLSKVATDLEPLSPAQLEALASADGKRPTGFGRRLSFRQMAGAGANTEKAAAEAALAKRRARERRFARVVGPTVSRVSLSTNEKERKATEEKLRGVVELFVRKPLESS